MSIKSDTPKKFDVPYRVPCTAPALLNALCPVKFFEEDKPSGPVRQYLWWACPPICVVDLSADLYGKLSMQRLALDVDI